MSFGSFHVDTLDLEGKYLAACRRGGYSTALDVLLAAPADMRRKIRGSDVEPASLIQHVASKICPMAVPLSSLAAPHVIKTGEAEIDGLIGRGVRSGCITELVGESAAGKSHLTLMLALAAQHSALSSCPGGAIVISSERVLETNRLVELAKVLRAKHGGPSVKSLLDNIQSSRVADIEALEHALAFVVPPMLEQARDAARPQPSTDEGSARTAPTPTLPLPVRLLIIDSLTALLRGETEGSSAGLMQRSRHICTVADRLKALAAAFDLAVVVVNQVKDVFGPEPGTFSATQAAPATQMPGTQMPASQSQFPPDSQQPVALDNVPPPMLYATQAAHFSGTSPGINKEAALGIVWANAVNTRIMLGRTGRRRMLTVEDVTRGKRPRLGTPNRPSSPAVDVDAAAAALHVELDTAKPTLIRRMHLVFSSDCAPGMLDYIITPSGIHALPGTFRALDLGPAIRRRDVRMRLAMAERRAGGTDDQGGLPEFKHDRQTQMSLPPSSQVDNDDDDDVYDDLGELPPEFWEGVEKLDEEPVAVGVVDF